ncbi:MAG: hypothetical protein E7Z90_01385 [Cyanobacteria bacterium SIG29]|nr:hypothetical protein [Cyanobacteria bacterium SIG29]
MSNFSKIVIIILIILSFFFIEEKYGKQINSLLSSIGTMPKIEMPNKNEETEQVKKPTDISNQTNETKNKTVANIYFLALDSDDNGIYKKVEREYNTKEDKLTFAIKELLKGPNFVEKSMGAYSEIPKTTKLNKIKYEKNKVIIDLSTDFQYGGGTDSIYSRMMQLIKTAVNNTNNKKIYLYLDGKQVNILGGEGIMVSQPLTEKSLEI